MEKLWYVYILKCGDGTLYTGITDDVSARLQAHREGKGAKYTRGRGPLELVYQEIAENHSAAAKRASGGQVSSRRASGFREWRSPPEK